jgi:tRNA threonylcarbamoyladenosine dehydratase
MKHFNFQMKNPTWTLVGAAAIGGIIGISGLWLSQQATKRRRIKDLKKEVAEDFKALSFSPIEPQQPALTPTRSQTQPVKKSIDCIPEELIREQLARNYAFLGENGVNKVRQAFVIVVGVGGVGSHAVSFVPHVNP